MRIIISILFPFLLILPLTGLCQDTTGSYLMRNVISVTEYKKIDTSKWEKISFETFTPLGLPLLSIQFDEQGKEKEKQIVGYNPSGILINIITYKNGKMTDTMETKQDSSGKITFAREFVYSSADGKKIPVKDTYFEYYSNGKLKKRTELSGYPSDTNSIYYCDTSGIATRTNWRSSPGLRTTQIDYLWNSERTEMKELHHQSDGTVYNTIVHKYKNNLEIEKIDSLTMIIPFYWKYDKKNRLIETNANVFYTLLLEYDNSGYPIHKTLKNIIYDSGEAPEKIEYKYEYKFRK